MKTRVFLKYFVRACSIKIFQVCSCRNEKVLEGLSKLQLRKRIVETITKTSSKNDTIPRDRGARQCSNLRYPVSGKCLPIPNM